MVSRQGGRGACRASAWLSLCAHDKAAAQDMVLVRATREFCRDRGAFVATGEGGLDFATWIWCRDMVRGLLGRTKISGRDRVGCLQG